MPALLKEIAGKIFNDKNYREVISKSGANFSIRILGVLVGYLFVFLVSRFYGPDVLGMHMLSLTVLMIFTVIGRLGMDSALVRHIAAAAQSNSWELVKETYFKTLS